MNVKFKDGKEIKFKKFGEIWLAESVIWEDTALHGSVTELRELKARVAEWFKENAPEEIREEYNARLPFWGEIKALPFKDQVAYREGKTNHIVVYFLGDEEDYDYPALCNIGCSLKYGDWFCCYAHLTWSIAGAVRLCLEERK